MLEFLRDLNPNILTVTGRPHRPSDQGSVENMIKFVKRTLGTVLAEYWLVCKHQNWTEVLGSVASAINMQHGGRKLTYLHMRQCMAKKWTMTSHVQRRKRANAGRYQRGLKVTNNPEFTEYACKKYIIDDDKICDDDAKGYFLDGALPSNKKEEVSEEYFFDHLQDDITEENHGKGKGYNTFNKFDAESNDDFVNPVCDVLAESSVEGPKKSIMMPLLQK